MRCNIFWLFFAFLTFVPAVSEATDQNLVKTYRYQTASVPPLRIDSVHVWLEKNDAYIDGTVLRLPGYEVDLNDYIEITVIDSHRKVLSCTRTDYSPKPVRFRSSRFGLQPFSYVAKINFVPPAASTIKATYVRLD